MKQNLVHNVGYVLNPIFGK